MRHVLNIRSTEILNSKPTNFTVFTDCDAIDLTSGRRAELKHEAVESWSDSHAPAPARQSACSQSYQGVFDCINVPLVNVVERMSARNVGATAHYVFVHWSTYNRKLPNVCPQHEDCCACAVFSTCAQHVHCPNLELKSDWFHVVHGSVGAVGGGWWMRGGAYA